MTFGMWAAVLPAIMEPGEFLATGTAGKVINPNLYFASWAAIIMSAFIFIGSMKNMLGDMSLFSTPSDFPFTTWAGLCLTSFVVMASATRVYKDENCDDRDGIDFCDRTKFALGAGIGSTILSFVMMWMGGRSFMRGMMDASMACVLLVLWSFGIAYITFGQADVRPAPEISNLYFSTWGSFGISLRLAASEVFGLFDSFMGGGATESTETKDDKKEEEAGGVEEPIDTPGDVAEA